MRIIIDDDGRGKQQSVVARIGGCYDIDKYLDEENHIYIGSYNIDNLAVYGETKEEAIDNLKIALDYLAHEFEAFYHNVLNGIVEIEEI